MNSDRPDHHRARAVDAALELQAQFGARAAAAFLAACGASFSLTVRVLADPQRRRMRSP